MSARDSDDVVPTADSADNLAAPDVVGNKTDTVAGTSIVALAKQTLAAVGVADGYHDVPTADSADNVVIRDVVGNKTDTVAGDSVVALEKQALAALVVVDEFHDVPTADSADNVIVSDVLGNKTDTVAGDSAIALVKQAHAQIDMAQSEREFWSELEDLTLSTTQADLAITNTVVIPAGSHGIPAGATIDCVHLMWKCRAIRDSSTGANAIDNTAAQAVIQIDDVANTGWTDAYSFTDDSLATVGSAKEPGISVESLMDIKALVDAADTYDIQIENCEVDGDNLFLHDFQWGLKVNWH